MENSQLITDLTKSEELEKQIFAALTLDTVYARNQIDSGLIDKRLTPALSRALLQYGLSAFLSEYPVGREKAVPLIQEFVNTQIKDVLPKSFPSPKAYNQEVIQQAIKCFRSKIFPEDRDSMEKMRPVRSARLKAILEKLRDQKKAILDGNSPLNVISKYELTKRIIEIIGLDSPYKKTDDAGWLRLVEMVSANIVSNDNAESLSELYHVNRNIVFQIKKSVMSKITTILPGLEETLDYLWTRTRTRGWFGRQVNAAKEAKETNKRRQRENETCYTEALPAKPLTMNEEEIAQWFCPGTDIKNITQEIVEESFLKHIKRLRLQFDFTEDQIKAFVHPVAIALVNPDANVNFSQDLFMFLTKIGRSGKSEIDQIAMTIRKLLSSGGR